MADANWSAYTITKHDMIANMMKTDSEYFIGPKCGHEDPNGG